MACLTSLPDDLPQPEDDGKAKHLEGMDIPLVSLESTNGEFSTKTFQKGNYILFCYPMTGKPDIELPKGWNDIPGARGCTPENLVFKQLYLDFKDLNVTIYGISTQSIDDQNEMAQRLQIPFEVISDENHLLTKALNLPTMSVENILMIKRITLVIQDGTIKKVFYPVFPPNKHPNDVLQWVKESLSV